jgi:hypothetical protein
MRASLKATLAVAGAAGSLAVAAGPAAAVTVDPGGDLVASGETQLSADGIPVTCTSTFTANVPTDGQNIVVSDAQITGDFPCGLVEIRDLPWGGQYDSSSQVTITGVSVGVTALGINCGPGNLVGGWDNDTSSLVYDNAEIPGGSSVCTVTGALATDPAQSVSD